IDESLIELSVHHTFKRYMAVLHNDMNGRQRLKTVPRSDTWVAIDSAKLSPSDLIIHRGRWQHFDVIDDVRYTLNAFDHVFCVGLQHRTGDRAEQCHGAAVDPECQVVENSVVRKHYQLVADLPGYTRVVRISTDESVIVVLILS